MNIVELLRRTPTDHEKQISDVANKILATFIDALQSAEFRYVRFHTYPTNDPNGFGVIYVENEGYTLVMEMAPEDWDGHLMGFTYQSI